MLLTGVLLPAWIVFDARTSNSAQSQAFTMAGGALLLACVAGLAVRLLLLQLRGRIEAERERSDSEAKFRTCFEHLADGMLVLRVEPDGRLLYEEVNPAAQTILGRSPAETIGRAPAEIWPADPAAVIEARSRECIAQGRAVTYAAAVELPSGPRKLSMTLAPVHDGHGRINRLVKSIVDITERDQLENQLRAGQKMEAVGRLTAGIAHDFNNLLQAQAGSLELLLDEVRELAPAREYAEIAISSARRAAQLTHHLLAFAGKQVLLPEMVPVAPLLAEVAVLIGRMVGPAGRGRVGCRGRSAGSLR